MKRRDALKTLGMAAAGLVALPAWANGWTARDVAVDSSTFTPKEQTWLSSVAETIIPRKNGVGAIPQEVDKFLIRLFDECYEEDERKNIQFQLNVLNEKSLTETGNPFSDGNQAQREQLLLTFSDSGNESEERFFQLVKRETIRGFRTSKVVMEDYYGYRVIPGRYNGNVDVEA